MMLQPGQETIALQILPNISWSKGNQTIKVGQLIEYNKTFFFKIYAENKAGWLVPDLLCMIFQEKCFSCYILFTDQIL